MFWIDIAKIRTNNFVIVLNAIKCKLPELTTKTVCIPIAVSDVLIYPCTRIPLFPD